MNRTAVVAPMPFFLLGELRPRFESLWPCMLLHFLHNGFVLLANLS